MSGRGTNASPEDGGPPLKAPTVGGAPPVVQVRDVQSLVGNRVRELMAELEPYLEGIVLGNSVRIWITAAGVLFLSVIVARLIRGKIASLAGHFTRATKTNFDDRLIESSVGPASSLAVLAGFHFAVAILEMPEGMRSILQRGLLIAAAVLMSVLILRAIDVLFVEVVRPWASRDGEVDEQLIRYGRFFLKLIVVAVSGVMVLERVGLNVMSLVTGLGIGGMAVALAAQETLGNMMGSLQIMTDHPFGIGDWVRVRGHMGIVQEIGLRSTKIMTRSRIMVVIPNKALAESDIQNLSVGGDLAVELALGLVYDTTADEMDRAVSILRELFVERPDIADQTQIQFLEYADFSLVIQCTYYIKDLARYWDVQHQVNVQIKRLFDAEGLSFAFPTQTVHLVKPD